MVHWVLGIALIVPGLILALPGGELVGYTKTELNLAAFAIGLPAATRATA